MHSASRKQHILHLSDEEALALLELCIYSGWENEPVKNKVMHKLAEICKQYECEAAMAELSEGIAADEKAKLILLNVRHQDDGFAKAACA